MNKVLDFFNKIMGLMVFLIFIVVFMEHIHHAHHWFRGHHEHFKTQGSAGDSVKPLPDSVTRKY